MERACVVNVYESPPRFAIPLFEIEITDHAFCSVVAYTGRASLCIPFEAVDGYPLDGPLFVDRIVGHLTEGPELA